MGKFDKDLRQYLETMGFTINSQEIQKVDEYLKVIIYKLVRNIISNLVSVCNGTTDVIDKKVIQTASRICKHTLSKFKQHGGDPVLPSEYFSGVLSPHYTPQNGDMYQSVAPTNEFVRPGMEMSFVGGQPSDSNESFIRGYVVHVCIKSIMNEIGLTSYKFAPCAIDMIVSSVHQNLIIIFNDIYKSNSISKSSKLCPLTGKRIKSVVSKRKFSFLR